MRLTRRSALAAFASGLALAPGALRAQPRAAGARLTMEAVNDADLAAARAAARGQMSPGLVKVQVLLDRAAASPGVIDGLDGENLRKAVRAARDMRGLPAGREIDQALWDALGRDAGEPVLKRHRITEEEARTAVAPDLSRDYAELARRRDIPFRTHAEMFAERFHMDEDLLKALNPDAAFDRAGTEIVVAAPGEPRRRESRLLRVVVERSGAVRALGRDRRLIAFYPATVGSAQNPSPRGTHRVKGVARNPTYYYNPDVNFVQGNNRERLQLPGGPNNPVGTVWIDLSEPTYGIHGTPEPSEIDKTSSHGCVRLTNWDAEELAGLVHTGLAVEFRD
jgi:lipoprotein-anchoring transpeptidase ErfK/SrfK